MRASPRETALNYAILTILALIVMYPLLGIAGLALQSSGARTGGFSFPPELTIGTLQHAWDQGNFAIALRNSAVVASSATLISITLAVLAGYAFGTMTLPFSSPLFYAFLAGLVVPLEAYLVPLYYELRTLSLLDSLPGVILPLSAQMLPFGIFWMRAQFRAMPPSLIDAARIDGAGTWAVLRHVLLPLARPALTSLAVLTFLWAWNDFLLALVIISGNDLRTAPLQLGLFVGLRTSDTSGLAAAALIVSAPVMVVYVFFQRRLIQGLMDGAIKE